MEQKSGNLIIDNDGKLILTGEIFDKHGSYTFNSYIDTGNSLNIIITKDLANTVCAKVEKEITIDIGGGTNKTKGEICTVNLQFGNLIIKDYKVTVINGTRNLIGIKFLQDAGIMMLIDFHKGKTMGGFLSTDRKFVKAFGKAAHCISKHNNDITKSDEPCPTCGEGAK